VCAGVLNIYGQIIGNDPNGGNMEELHALGLAISRVEMSQIFHHKVIKIQDHGVASLTHTNPMSQRTPQSEFV
jgi:hypothetical protein